MAEAAELACETKSLLQASYHHDLLDLHDLDRDLDQNHDLDHSKASLTAAMC